MLREAKGYPWSHIWLGLLRSGEVLANLVQLHWILCSIILSYRIYQLMTIHGFILDGVVLILPCSLQNVDIGEEHNT
jgi:hypothetical protein